MIGLSEKARVFGRRPGAGRRGTSRLRPRIAALLVLVAAVLLSPPAHAVNIERVTSPGGVEAWLVRDSSIPIISLEIAFRGGAALDPGDKLGLANMVSGLLDEGAGDLDSEAFQRRLNDLSIELGFDAGLDQFFGRMRTLTTNRDEAFRLLGLALTEPRFEPEAVERIRNQILTILAREAEDPDYLATLAWYAAAFPGHPYGRPAEGTPDSVRRIAADDLRAFVGRRLARDNLLIGVAGDIAPAELGALLDRTFGGLPAHAAPDDVAETAPEAVKDTVVIDRDIPQSVAVFGGPGVKRDDPDYYAAYAMNYILGGGGFNSRLTDEVREKRGLAYSVYSYLAPLEHAGLIFGGVATRNGRVKESLDIIRAQWRRMRDHGASADELANAKSYLNGSFPLRLDTTAEIAGTLVSIQIGRLGIDYIDRRSEFINSVTKDDIERVARRLLDPETLTIVVVGRPDGLSSAQTPPANPM